MNLKFLGYGSAFYALEGDVGTNTACIKEGKNLLLIDCGYPTARKLIRARILEEIENIFIIITHTHADHVGGLASLIEYTYWAKKINVFILDSPISEEIMTLLKLQNVFPGKLFEFCKKEVILENFGEFQDISRIRTEHSNMECYGIQFETKEGPVLYTGDTSDIDWIMKFVQKDFSTLYSEVCLNDFPGNPHMPIWKLEQAIPREKRSKCILMHFDNQECIYAARRAGFKTAAEFAVSHL